jgi:SpoVK/Ycf46/Vps4 family AAA+-type ATPase
VAYDQVLKSELATTQPNKRAQRTIEGVQFNLSPQKGIMSQTDLTQLMTRHRIILVRCNPLDREWIVSTHLSNRQRWRLNLEIGPDPVSSPFSKLFTRDDKPLLSLLLTWLQDKTFPVFVIGTLNRIDDLPIEATRAGRFDTVWEVDSPDAESRLNLFLLFLKRFDAIDRKQALDNIDKLVNSRELSTDDEIYHITGTIAQIEKISEYLHVVTSAVPQAIQVLLEEEREKRQIESSAIDTRQEELLAKFVEVQGVAKIQEI